MLPFRFDPVEQVSRPERLTPVERVREAIYIWVELEPGTKEEHVAWQRVRDSARMWLFRSERS